MLCNSILSRERTIDNRFYIGVPFLTYGIYCQMTENRNSPIQIIQEYKPQISKEVFWSCKGFFKKNKKRYHLKNWKSGTAC